VDGNDQATGWFAAAAGCLLLAAGETWQIVEHHHPADFGQSATTAADQVGNV